MTPSDCAVACKVLTFEFALEVGFVEFLVDMVLAEYFEIGNACYLVVV